MVPAVVTWKGRAQAMETGLMQFIWAQRRELTDVSSVRVAVCRLSAPELFELLELPVPSLPVENYSPY